MKPFFLYFCYGLTIVLVSIGVAFLVYFFNEILKETNMPEWLSIPIVVILALTAMFGTGWTLVFAIEGIEKELD